MATQVTRRTLLRAAALTGAGLGGLLLPRPAPAQRVWFLNAGVVAVAHGFAVAVTYSVDFAENLPLYIRVADSRGASVFLSWERITEPAEVLLLDAGAFDIPYGARYSLAVVLPSGQPHPLSPVVEVDLPALPAALNT